MRTFIKNFCGTSFAALTAVKLKCSHRCDKRCVAYGTHTHTYLLKITLRGSKPIDFPIMPLVGVHFADRCANIFKLLMEVTIAVNTLLAYLPRIS